MGCVDAAMKAKTERRHGSEKGRVKERQSRHISVVRHD